MKPKNSHLLSFVWYFYHFTMYQKSEWYSFDKGSIDMGKVKQKWKNATWAGIENVKAAKSDIFNFNSATRWHFWTFNTLFPSMDPWSKKYHSELWKNVGPMELKGVIHSLACLSNTKFPSKIPISPPPNFYPHLGPLSFPYLGHGGFPIWPPVVFFPTRMPTLFFHFYFQVQIP